MRLHLAGELFLTLATRFPELKAVPEAIRQHLDPPVANTADLQEALDQELQTILSSLAEQRRSSGRKQIQRVKEFIDEATTPGTSGSATRRRRSSSTPAI